MVNDDTIKLSKYKRRRLISSLMSSYPEKCEHSGGFHLKSNSDGFSQRLNSVFGGLKDFEQKHDDWCEKQKSGTVSNKFTDEINMEECDSSSDTVFKRPVAVPPRKRKYVDTSIPEFRKHPEKWVKYSLSDVSGTDMSDISNKKIAMDFIEEMRKRKAPLQMIDEGDSESIKFRSPDQKTNKEASGSTFQDGKFTMPEYVIGKKNQSSKLRSVKGDHIIPNKSKVLLHHLDCSDDELSAEVSSEKSRKSSHHVFLKPHYRNELKNEEHQKDVICDDISV